jgi:hypothetical protein
MNGRLPLLTLLAAFAVPGLARAAAETAPAPLAADFAAGSSAAKNAVEDQRALAAGAAEPAAKKDAAPKPVEFSLASNDSNSPEIYRALIASGAKPVCATETVDEGGFPRVHEACDAAGGGLDHVTVYHNYILWQTTQNVKVSGDVHCWQKWIAPGGVHRRPSSLWTFCAFRGTVEP